MPNETKADKSLEASLEEARRFGASVDEVRKAHALIRKRQLPAYVRTFELKFGRDSTGEPAMWVWFVVDNDKNPSTEKISSLTEFGNSVRADLLHADLRYWPYVDFREAS